MIVIKLGGSLAVSGKLKACLDKIDQIRQDRPTIIVPGGGLFADQVRSSQQQWQFDDRTAHQMAILAMQQMGLMFKALKPHYANANSIAALRGLSEHQDVVIWAPDIGELDEAGIPSSWDISSDSLSAWLAQTIGADALILVKSATIGENEGVLKLVERSVVDKSFYEYTQHVSFNIKVVNAEEFVSWFSKNGIKKFK